MHEGAIAVPHGLRVWGQASQPEGWEALLAADPGSTAAQRAGVAAAFAAVLPGHTTEYLLAADATGLAGGMVLCVRHVAGAEWLHAMPMMLPGAPLARPGYREAVDQAIAKSGKDATPFILKAMIQQDHLLAETLKRRYTRNLSER